jgi:hypothetical protein
MPDDYQYEIMEPWLATDVYLKYGKCCSLLDIYTLA